MSKSSVQRNAAMLDMYEEGYTLGEIADNYGVSRQRVHQIIGPFYDEAHYGRRKKEERRAKLTEAYERIINGESTMAEEAEALGITERSLYSGCLEIGLRLIAERPTRRHGTPYCYKLGCRRPECVAATRAARRASKQQRIERGPPEHGTENAYTNYDCRCLPCREAGAVKNREARIRRRRRDSLKEKELPNE